MEKMYLQPLYKPFLEEDAVKYLNEQERQLVQQAAAFGEMQVSEPRAAIQATGIPAYESRFAQLNSMTQEKWDELDDDNKLDFVQVFLPRGSH